MAENSKIEWTDHTFNPWWGCQRVSPGCQHCYAETLANRYGHAVWGPAKTTQRRMMSNDYWKQPYKWHKQAVVGGVRRRVFCASMADVFEDHPDVVEARRTLFDVISDTPGLDWLLLTKRPENIKPMLIDAGCGFQDLPPWVWIGTSVEDQEQADERIPHLLNVPARVRFLSCEPLLGPVDLSEMARRGRDSYGLRDGGIHWVICGGESGHGARPMHPDWARSLRDQCQAAGVAYFFKQWGEYAPAPWDNPKPALAVCADGTHVVAQIGHVLGFREADEVCMERMGKHAAGRLLDGREWNEAPQ
jgi:protein gp37